MVSGTTGWVAFTHRDFRLFFIVRILNGAMGVMLQLAIGWEVWHITRDEWTLGMIGLVLFAPNLLFFLAAGTVADRVKRQYILGTSYAVQAICAILLIITLDAAATFVADLEGSVDGHRWETLVSPIVTGQGAIDAHLNYVRVRVTADGDYGDDTIVRVAGKDRR